MPAHMFLVFLLCFMAVGVGGAIFFYRKRLAFPIFLIALVLLAVGLYGIAYYAFIVDTAPALDEALARIGMIVYVEKEPSFSEIAMTALVFVGGCLSVLLAVVLVVSGCNRLDRNRIRKLATSYHTRT